MSHSEIINSPATVKIDGRTLSFATLTELVWNVFVPKVMYPYSGSIEALRRDMRDRLIVVRDYLGMIVDHAFVVDYAIEVNEERRKRRHAIRWWPKETYTFRRGPVPFSRKRRGGPGHCLRKPGTFQERKVSAGLHVDDEAAEYGIFPRGRRNHRNLPTLWDDIVRSDCDDSGWKRHRRRQYKEK